MLRRGTEGLQKLGIDLLALLERLGHVCRLGRLKFLLVLRRRSAVLEMLLCIVLALLRLRGWWELLLLRWWVLNIRLGRVLRRLLMDLLR